MLNKNTTEEIENIDSYLDNNPLDIEKELSSLNDDYSLIEQLKKDPLEDLNNPKQPSMQDLLAQEDQYNLQEMYNKVEVDQDEAKEIFNNMVKDLEVDLEGSGNQKDKINKVEKMTDDIQGDQGQKQASLNNLARDIETQQQRDGQVEREMVEEQQDDNMNENENKNNPTSNENNNNNKQSIKNLAGPKRMSSGNQNNKSKTNITNDSPNSKMLNESEENQQQETAVNQVDNLIENNVQSKGVIKYQKAKIAALEEELELIVEKMKSLESENQDLKKVNKALMKDQKKDKTTSNVLNQKVEKMKEVQDNVQEKYEALTKVHEELKKDLETIHKQLKTREKDLANRDARLNKSVEEVERLKNQLKLSKEQTRFNDMSKEVEDLKNVNKLQEKQRDEVYEAFKKSLRLVDLQKKQNVHLEQATLLNVNEKEFMRMMEHKIM